MKKRPIEKIDIEVGLPDRIPAPRIRTHEWTDSVAIRKKIGRWNAFITREQERIEYAREQIGKLEESLRELKENTEFSQTKQEQEVYQESEPK